MKNLFAIIALFVFGTAMAQTNNNVTENASSTFNSISQAGANDFGAAAMFVNPAREVQGSIHLFEDWENNAVIHTNGNQKFLLRNINLNLKRNTFESKISKDSLFTFNFNNIEKFVINNRVYKNYYFDDDNRVYEVIYEDDEFQILKGFTLKFVEGSANPMLNRSNDKYIQKESYYIRKDGKIKTFKLKKSKILKLVNGDEAKADKIESYAKDNKLSFKREYDVQKILEYSAKN